MNDTLTFQCASKQAGLHGGIVGLTSRAATEARRKTGLGRYQLDLGQALTLKVREAGMLRVIQGRIWLTFNHADQDYRVRAGDHFLTCCDSLALSAGQVVVLESLSADEVLPGCVCWEAASAVTAKPIGRSQRWSTNGLKGRLPERPAIERLLRDVFGRIRGSAASVASRC